MNKEALELKDKVIVLKFINSVNIELKLEFNVYNNLNILVNSFLTKDDGNINTDGSQMNIPIIQAVYKKILEVSIPILTLGVPPNNLLNFYAVLTYKDNPLAEIERFPVNGYFETVIPDKNFEIINWLV